MARWLAAGVFRPHEAAARANDTEPWAAAFRATENQVVHDGADAIQRSGAPVFATWRKNFRPIIAA
jgi:hypothetical protein